MTVLQRLIAVKQHALRIMDALASHEGNVERTQDLAGVIGILEFWIYQLELGRAVTPQTIEWCERAEGTMKIAGEAYGVT